MRQLWLRADGGAGIGIGHVMRCLALAEAAHEIGLSCTLVTDPTGIGEHLGKRAGVHVRDAPPDARWLNWTRPRDLVVFDGYHLVDEVRIAAASQVRIAVIDDFGTGDFPVDVVVCPNPPAEPTYSVNPSGTVLSGPNHAPVRARFRELRRRRNPGTDRLVLSFGGADPHGMLAAAAHALDASSPFRSVHGVVGPSAPDISTSCVDLVRDPPDMAAVMDAANAAILAAGSTVWEACTLGLPIATVPVADNQVGIVRALREARAALVLQAGDRFADDVKSAVAELARPAVQEELADAAMELVDGRGAARVLAALLDS